MSNYGLSTFSSSGVADVAMTDIVTLGIQPISITLSSLGSTTLPTWDYDLSTLVNISYYVYVFSALGSSTPPYFAITDGDTQVSVSVDRVLFRYGTSSYLTFNLYLYAL